MVTIEIPRWSFAIDSYGNGRPRVGRTRFSVDDRDWTGEGDGYHRKRQPTAFVRSLFSRPNERFGTRPTRIRTYGCLNDDATTAVDADIPVRRAQRPAAARARFHPAVRVRSDMRGFRFGARHVATVGPAGRHDAASRGRQCARGGDREKWLGIVGQTVCARRANGRPLRHGPFRLHSPRPSSDAFGLAHYEQLRCDFARLVNKILKRPRLSCRVSVERRFIGFFFLQKFIGCTRTEQLRNRENTYYG